MTAASRLLPSTRNSDPHRFDVRRDTDGQGVDVGEQLAQVFLRVEVGGEGADQLGALDLPVAGAGHREGRD